MAASTAGSNVATKAGEREIVATRVVDAPREFVFKLWTDPSHVGQWWGPKGFTTTISEMDVRPGGVWRFVMHGPDGVDYENKIIYREIVKPERLVYSHVSGPQFHVTATFAEQGDKTKLTVRMLFESPTQREKVIKEFRAIEGLNQTLERLADRVASVAKYRSGATFTMPSDRELVSVRVFDAPRQLVFEAWTKPEHVKRWYGPRAYTMTVCEIDLRPGGAYRYVLRGSDGNDYAFSGVYREIVPPRAACEYLGLGSDAGPRAARNSDVRRARWQDEGNDEGGLPDGRGSRRVGQVGGPRGDGRIARPPRRAPRGDGHERRRRTERAGARHHARLRCAAGPRV